MSAGDENLGERVRNVVRSHEQERGAAAPPGGATTLGRYELVREAGRGGMAVIYEALDRELGRRVAVKVLRDTGNPDLVHRLHREAAAAARLRHPNIVPVHDVGQSDGCSFIAMDFIEGATLNRACASMSERQRVEAVETLARAVDHAHRHGIVHRDLKPQNVIVEQATGKPFLTDFGLARGFDSEPLTRSGAVIGTPAYMAPEQVRGESALVGPATDVWALGTILYELLADRPPFPGTSPAETYQLILAEDPAPLAHVHPDLMTICRRALEKQPSRRYATAAQFAEDLRRALNGEPIRARPPGLGARVVRRLRRNTLAAVLGAVALLLALGWGAVALVSSLRARAEASRHAAEAEAILARDAGAEALIEADEHARLSGDASLRYRVNRRLVDAALAARDFGLARLAIGTCRSVRPDEDLRPLLTEAETAEARRRRDRVLAALDDVRGGLGRADRPAGAPLLDEYVMECVQYNDEQTVTLLAEALAPLTARAGGDEGWTLEERDVLRFSFRVLGHLARRSGVEPLAAMMARLRDIPMAIECAQALCFTRRAEAYLPLVAARERFGSQSGFWVAVERFLPRIPAAPGGEEPATADGFFKRGMERHDRGDAEGALSDLAAALRLAPRSARLFNARGCVRRDTGDTRGAMEDLARAIELDASYYAAFNNRALARVEAGDFRGAVDDFTEALRLSPDNAAVLLNRAGARAGLHDLAGALSDADRVIVLDPACALAWAVRSSVRMGRGDATGAVEDATRAIDLDPRCFEAFNNRATAYRRQGKHDAALADLTRAIDLRPGSARTFYNRAAVHLDRIAVEAALQDIERALRLGLDLPVAYVLRGRVLHQKQDYRGAIADYDRALAQEPRDAEALNNRGRARMALKDTAGALSDFTRALEIDPGNAMFLESRGTARLERRELNEALADFDRALVLEPRRATTLTNRAAVKLMLGDADGALEDSQRAIDADPSCAMAYANRGKARFEKRDLPGAVADFEKFIALAPDHPQASGFREVLDRIRRESPK